MEHIIKLNPRNTLFPSEMQLLANTLHAMLNNMAMRRYYALRGKIGVNHDQRSPEEEMFIKACYLEKDIIKRTGNILAEIQCQEEFLSTYVGDEFKINECRFIAKKLEVIIPKMQARYFELIEIKEGEKQ